MDWPLLLIIFFVSLVSLLLLRVPVAFALFTVNAVAASVYFGIQDGARQLTLSMFESLTTFVFAPIPMFVLMGEFLFRSGLATRALLLLDAVLGRVPGRLGVLATGGGTVLGILSGSTIANTAMLASTLLPQMIKANYSMRLSMGSILASGGLAMIIPPSALAVVWGATADVAIGPLLIAGLIPGVIMAAMYIVVILGWSVAIPGASPPSEARRLPGAELARRFAIDTVPLGVILFLVLGLIFLGVATPTEAAALGAVGSFLLTVAYRRSSWDMVRRALTGTVRVTAAVFLIISAADVYSSIMGFSGATSGVVEWLVDLSAPPLVALFLMLLLVVILGCFLDPISIMVVTLPFYMPAVEAFGWEGVWFGIVMLIALQIGGVTPPLGMLLFVMKGAAPRDTKLTDVYVSALPFVAADMVSILIIALFPITALWLPSLMGG